MLLISIFYFVAVTKMPSIEAEFKSNFVHDYRTVKVSKQMVPFGIITAGVLECMACLQVILMVVLSKNALYVSYLNVLNIVVLTIGIVYITRLKELKMEKQFDLYLNQYCVHSAHWFRTIKTTLFCGNGRTCDFSLRVRLHNGQYLFPIFKRYEKRRSNRDSFET